MKKRSWYLNSKGLSLIEIMVALGVIGISIVVILMTERYKWDGFKRSRKVTEVTNIIEDRIEHMRMFIAAAPDSNWPPCPPANFPCETTFTEKDITLTRVIDEARNFDNETVANAVKVSFHAQWEIHSKTDSVEITTYVAKDF
ncbi:MAG: prepilin-type N-terminal cleavage/methylation domain-containing protein [Chitinivibrionales bacterium]|nr:prepilin-type N-terminal cleavage/methylation domain-containing protein [Chitinivibrionales bacterium]